MKRAAALRRDAMMAPLLGRALAVVEHGVGFHRRRARDSPLERAAPARAANPLRLIVEVCGKMFGAKGARLKTME